MTTLPIVSWGGRGPSIGFALFHNMTSFSGGPETLMSGDANFSGEVTEEDTEPFIDILLTPEEELTPTEVAVADIDESGELDEADLDGFMGLLASGGGPGAGPDWRHSYSTYLQVEIGQVRLVRDDGTEDIFVSDGSGGFISPPGVFDRLTAVAGGGYVLKSKAQWEAHYEQVPQIGMRRRLKYIYDASGNRVTCTYFAYSNPPYTPTSGKLNQIQDASGRNLILEYNPTTGKLIRINDAVLRKWELRYQDPLGSPPAPNKTGPFVELRGPAKSGENVSLGSFITFTYTSAWDITTITDRDLHTYTLEYLFGRLVRITDPAPYNQQEQLFSYLAQVDGHFRCVYTDRRSKQWIIYSSMESGNLESITNPLNVTQSFEYEQPDNLIHEVTRYTNGLNKEWTANYDSAGNLLFTTNPMLHLWSFTYDSQGLNRLIEIKPPGEAPLSSNPDKAVTLYYEDSNHPMKVTRAQEPRVIENGPFANTIVEYYDSTEETGSDPDDWNGLVKRITTPGDANPMVVEYRYDERGQLAQESEGPPLSPLLTTIIPVTSTFNFTDLSQLQDSGNGICSPHSKFDRDGNMLNSACNCSVPSGGLGEGDCPPPGTAVCEECDLPNGMECRPEIPDPKPVETGCTVGDIQYNKMGQVTQFTKCVSDGFTGLSTPRIFTMTYDELGRQRTSQIESDESSYGATALIRQFTHTPEAAMGFYTMDGPDGQTTTVTLDDAGRVDSFLRTLGGTTLLAGTVEYYADDRVEKVTYTNGTESRYTYNDAGQLTGMFHGMTDQSEPLHALDYQWSADGLVKRITEHQSDMETGMTYFTYDNRNRLTEEHRYGSNSYHLIYTYDMAGNRLRKTDALSGIVTDYTYDVSNPELYQSQNNRLMYSRRYQSSNNFTLEERWYSYDLLMGEDGQGNPIVLANPGRVNYVVRKIAGDVDPVSQQQWLRGTQVWYNSNGQVWFARSLRWQIDTGGHVTNYALEAGMEYRYDSDRQRYLARPRSANMLGVPTYGSGVWTEYAGDTAYDDLAISVNGGVPSAASTKSYAPGVGEVDLTGPNPAAWYSHGNLIGTTEAQTSGNAGEVRRGLFTAFGEPLCGVGSTGNCAGGEAGLNTRYGYAGAWGYQAGKWDGTPGACDNGTSSQSCDPLAEIGWIHVGARYYDRSAGRFMQRDPIGIMGGLNTYVYCMNLPTRFVDPSGLDFWDGSNSFHEAIAKGLWQNLYSDDELANMSNAGAAARAVGASVAIGGGGFVVYTFVASGGAYSMLCATTYRGGFHAVIYGSGGAGWLHFLGRGTGPLTASPGFPFFALPMRYPGALQTAMGTSNCLISAIRAMIAAW